MTQEERAALEPLGSEFTRIWDENRDVLHEADGKRIAELHEKLASAYIALSGKRIHASDCATSNAPALEPGPCDCEEKPHD